MAEELGEMDRLILKGISLGYKSPRKLSERINIDVVTLRSKITDLSTKGYVDNKDVRVAVIDKFISILEREEYVGCGKLTGKGYNAVNEEGFEDIISGFKHEKGIFKHAQKRQPPSFISKLIDGAFYGLGFIGFVVLLIIALIIGVVVVGLIIFLQPSFIGDIFDILFSFVGAGRGMAGV